MNAIHGFALLEKQDLPDIKGEGFLFQHEKSGARLFYIKSNDDNKVFFAGFKTPPSDNCGTPHILEHSVLCGSRKYTTKDPFNELAKGSLHTFLNAMTYNDKTLYPVASRNKKDFYNLMDVYLDAVFYPRIYEKKEIFLQEGWHYEMEQQNQPLGISGVVYNEMKGAFSDPERLLDLTIARSLFPHSAYGYESGGEPQAIPELTYESFLAFHKKFYHPSNCYLYLYGDMDLDETLLHMEEYLKDFTKISVENEIMMEPAFSERKSATCFYPATENEEAFCYFTLNFVTGDTSEVEAVMAFELFSYMLLENNSSPLRQRLLGKGICQDLEGWYDASLRQPVFSIIGKNGTKGKEQEFYQILWDTLKEFANQGLDEEFVLSNLNVWEFLLREEDYGYRPKGLVYGTKAMKTWLHGESPWATLQPLQVFQQLKADVKNGYFQQLIKERLLNNTHASFVVMHPDQGKQKRDDIAWSKLLQEKKDALTPEEQLDIVKETQNLKAYQSMPETEASLASIPVLPIEEVKKTAEWIPSQLDNVGAPCLFTPLESNGVLYAHAAFDLSVLTEEQLPYAGLLAECLGKIDTKQYTYEQLPVAVNMITGGLESYCNSFQREEESFSGLFVNVKYLEHNSNAVWELLTEIINHSQYTNESHLKRILKESKINRENHFMNAGHAAAAQRSMSHLFDGYRVLECTKGITYYQQLCQWEQFGDANGYGQLASRLEEVAKLLFQKDNCIFSIGGSAEGKSRSAVGMKACFDQLQPGSPVKNKILFAPITAKEGIMTPGQIVYNSKAGNYRSLGMVYSGKMKVLKTIIDLEYLWNKVRVEGGAYGCGCQIFRSGGMYLYSYRDPHVNRTMQAFDATAAFLENFTASSKEMNRYLLGAINSLDKPLTNGDKAGISFSRYLCKISQKDLQQEREELLSTTAADITKYQNLFQEPLGSVCTIGNESKIAENKQYYTTVTWLNGKIY